MPLPAGRLLARVTTVPVLAVTAWLVVAFPLLLIGRFTPLAGLVVALPVVVLAVATLPRWTPDLTEDTPWWSVLGIGAVTAAFAAVQVAYHSEQLIIRRDAASYAQFAIWLAEHGSLPIPQQRDLIAGDDPSLGYQSLAYYQVGEDIWPQFLSGAPLTLATGHWLGGVDAMLITAPLIGALGVLTFAGLAARLIGPRWAPPATLLLAVCLPQQWVSRSTYSEPLTQVLLLGGLVLAYDALARPAALRDRWGKTHALAAAAGLAFGLGTVVRVDALRDILPVLGFVGLLLVARRGQALPMLAGLLVGVCYGYVAGFVLSRPYLDYLADSVRPLLLVSAVVGTLTAIGVLALWRRGLPSVARPSWLPTAVAVLAIAVLAGIAARPLLYTHRGHGSPVTGNYVGYVQQVEGLAHDPGRTYTEMSLYWVGWYVGLATIGLAAIGVAVLLHRALRGREPRWVLPLMVLLWSVTTVLLRPAITPDHPWASRRLVVLVIPAFILVAVWALSRLVAHLRARTDRPGLVPLTAAMGVVAMLLPTAVTATGVMGYRMDAGSVSAIERLCRAVPRQASVVIVDPDTASNFTQVIRGMCGVPTARMDHPDPEAVARVAAEIRDRQREPVLAASQPEKLTPYVPDGPWPSRAFHVDTEQDPSTLMEPPAGAWAFSASVWLTTVPRS